MALSNFQAIEMLRQRMLAEMANIPAGVLDAALATTVAKLRAKKPQIVTHKGQITKVVNVEDHETQLKAADQIYSLIGMYSKESDKARSVTNVAIHIDNANGVMRIVTDDTERAALPENATVVDGLPVATATPVDPWAILLDEEGD